MAKAKVGDVVLIKELDWRFRHIEGTTGKVVSTDGGRFSDSILVLVDEKFHGNKIYGGDGYLHQGNGLVKGGNEPDLTDLPKNSCLWVRPDSYEVVLPS